MKRSRREFIELGLRVGTALPLLSAGLYGCRPKTAADDTADASAGKKLKILILGGTGFLGPHQIAYALGRGHSITTFTRGRTESTVHQGLFDQVEQLIGDRADNLSALEGRQWDVVIDNSGQNAEWTKKSAALLRDNCALYLYTSSTGVYYPYLQSDYKEDAEVVLTEPAGITDEVIQMEYRYGVMKANSEREALSYFGPERTIIVRPTYMIGPADRSNRFIYWPIRLSKGGETMVPGKAEDMVQYADVRDVAEWMIRLLEDKKAGTYNAVGPKEAQNIYAFVEEAQQAFAVEASYVKVDDYAFLQENDIYNIVPWIMPVGNDQGSAKINNDKAKENGFSLRPLVDTVKDTYEWWYSDAVSQERRDKVESDPGYILAKEQAILEKWKGQLK